MRRSFFKNIGPGALVAAAFIGPGTVTLCIKAGAGFGYSLIWALVISTLATIFLQEMAARIGLVSQSGLADAIRNQLKNKWAKFLALTLIVVTILVGNTAYQAGNISGGSLGISAVFNDTSIQIGNVSINYINIILGGIAFIILIIGNYKILERILITLVILMSLSFVITALFIGPDWSELLKGAFKPNLPQGSLLTIIGLIGTTVVPYNLFLHSSLVQEKWKGSSNLKNVRRDTIISIGLGGLVSIAIVIAAASIQGSQITSSTDIAMALEPVFGKFAIYITGLGVLAAGITSSITAPLAAAYVAKGCFNWEGGIKSTKFKAVWIFVLVIGTIVSAVGKSPIEIIHFAQIANGILLPIIIVFLIWIVNKSEIMGTFTNSIYQNLFSIVLLLLAICITTGVLYKIFYPIAT